jgi:UDP-N-acetylglucosamine:LPS N-acetylglucosamine transferase
MASVLEENNISKSVLFAELSRILDNKEQYKKISEAGLQFENSREAANLIARELLKICVSHL